MFLLCIRLGFLSYAGLFRFFSWFQDCALAANVNGSVSGTVTDDSGRALAGARVFVSAAPPSSAAKISGPPVATGRVAAIVTADAFGAFQAKSLPAGQYLACAELGIEGWLDPCHWSTTAPAFTLQAGQETKSVKITMPRGAILTVQLIDAGALLKPVNGPIYFECQLHLVNSKGHRYNVPIQSHGSFARDHAITIPYGALLTLKVLSPTLVVGDAPGKDMPTAGLAVATATGSALAPLQLIVSRRK